MFTLLLLPVFFPTACLSISMSFDAINASLIAAAQETLIFQNISNPAVFFIFYQKQGPRVNLTRDNAQKYLTKQNRYIFMIHGIMNTGTQPWIRNMSRAFHARGIFNTIGVDYSAENPRGDIMWSVGATRAVGYFLGDFIASLGVPLEAVHLIGHSLGAEVASFCGKRLNGEIGRITGLDSTIPLLYFTKLLPETERISMKDAQFVDIIHTTFMFNMTVPYGTAEFWINYKEYQPDCAKFTTPNDCGHQMAAVYYTKTILNDTIYPGFKRKFRHNLKNSETFMGYWVNKTSKGFYYVKAKATGIAPGNYTLKTN